MDEYLFIQWAKLQSDRRRLEREEREGLRAQQPRVEHADEYAPVRKPVEARGPKRALPSIFHWRAQS